MGETFHGGLCTGSDRRCNHGSWHALEHRRDIQRSDGNPEPHRVVPVVRYGGETCERLFCKTSQINVSYFAV